MQVCRVGNPITDARRGSVCILLGLSARHLLPGPGTSNWSSRAAYLPASATPTVAGSTAGYPPGRWLVKASQASGCCCPSSVSYTHLRAHETRHDLVCRLLLEKKKKKRQI